VAGRPIDGSLSKAKAAQTAQAVPKWQIVPSLWIRDQLPDWMATPLPGLDLYQWVGIVIALGVSAIFSWLGLRLIEWVMCAILRWSGFVIEKSLIASKLRPIAFQLGLFFLIQQLRLLDLPTFVVGTTTPVLMVVWFGLMAWTGLRLIDLGMILYARSERLHDRRSLSDMIVPTAANGMKLAVLVVAVSCQVYLLGSRETLTQLLAGLGLVGLAASLAAQDTLKNFFGTLLLIGEHPFRIGEHVAVNSAEGIVESVGFRSTRIRTFEDSLLTIPNSVMASALIDNRGARNCRRYRTIIPLSLDTSPEKLVAMRDALRTFAVTHPRFRADKIEIHINGLGDQCIELFVQLYFRVSNYTDEMACRDELSREILTITERMGIEISVLTHEVRMMGEMSEPPRFNPPAPKHLGRDRVDGSKAGSGYQDRGPSKSGNI